MDIAQNIALFQELLQCGNHILFWHMDAGGSLLSSNCLDDAAREVFDSAFSLFGIRERMLAEGRVHGHPVILGTSFGLVYGVAMEKEGGATRSYYVVGPVFLAAHDPQRIGQALEPLEEVAGLSWKHHFLKRLAQIPNLQYLIFTRYLLMLHYCLTGEHLAVSDIHVRRKDSPSMSFPQEDESSHDRYHVYQTEREMLNAVRSGNLDYKRALNNSMMSSNGVPVKSSDPMEAARVSNIVFCTLVTRAAMEGGLSPEQAYALGDYYIQACVQAKNVEDLSSISRSMYDDFVRRVHRLRTGPSYSPEIRRCCDEMLQHPEQKFSAERLSLLVGYSPYYLSRKFRAETGKSISDYLSFVRIERAKQLLLNPDLPVQDISDALGFSTRSYFSQTFHQLTGETPSQYRDRLLGSHS